MYGRGLCRGRHQGCVARGHSLERLSSSFKVCAILDSTICTDQELFLELPPSPTKFNAFVFVQYRVTPGNANPPPPQL